MDFVFSNARISAIQVALPAQERCFDEEFPNYKLTEDKARRFKKMMGVDRHRIAPPGVTSGDLCQAALTRLLDQGTLRKEDIGALVFVSQTPDHFLPPTSNVIQGKLGLGRDVVCLDLNQGCAGFLMGLMQAFMLLNLPGMGKVVVLCGDTASRQVSPFNRVSWPLLGDAGSATVVERSPGAGPIHMNLQMDGARHGALMVPAGAYRQPSSAETLREVEVEEGVVRSLEHVHMDGAAVFAFTMEDVPPLIEGILALSGDDRESIDQFLFHQPNQFMLQQMGDKMRLPRTKLPSNIVGLYGNCSSVSLPLNIAHNCGAALLGGPMRVCLSGFGVGLTWSAMVLTLGPLDACGILDVPTPEA